MTGADGAGPLDASVAALHAALDRWHSVVRGVAAEASSPSDAAADPRLEAAEAVFDEAMEEFHVRADEVLGISDDPGDQAGDDGLADLSDADDPPVEGDIFVLQFFVGLPEGSSAGRLEDVIEHVDAGGFDVVSRLEDAGFVVPSFASSRGELTMSLLDDDDDDNDNDDDDGRVELP